MTPWAQIQQKEKKAFSNNVKLTFEKQLLKFLLIFV